MSLTNPITANTDEPLDLVPGFRYFFSAVGNFGSGTFSIEYLDSNGTRQTVKTALTSDGDFDFYAQEYEYFLVLSGATTPSISYNVTKLVTEVDAETALAGRGPWAGTIAVADASAMQAIIDAGTVEVGQLFSLVSDRSIRRFEGGSKSRIVSDLPQGNPTGYARMTSVKVIPLSITVQHDGTDGATGVCYSVNGGTPVYSAVASDTNVVLAPTDADGSPIDVAIWPASSATSGRKGNLTKLTCYFNDLTSLDVSGLTALTKLDCSSNDLASLDASGLTALTELRCPSNPLTSLDVSGLTALTELYCNNTNQLTSLDVSGLTALTKLYCNSNQLTSLDVSGLTALTELYCYSNQLTSLDASGLTALTKLGCYSNQLTSLDVSGLTALTQLTCYSNQLTSLDVSGLTALTKLDCNSNQLTSLDVSGLTALTNLDCKSNSLTTLRSVGVALSYAFTYTPPDGSDLSGNSLSAVALDQFYSDLAPASGNLLVTGNPGTTGDDPTIATAKGYTVIGT